MAVISALRSRFCHQLETERALLLEVLQQTDTDSDDNSFDILEVISEINTCLNCKRQPQAGVELKRCSRCQINHLTCKTNIN